MATTTERRCYKRYCASGQAEFWSASVKSIGKLLDVAKGGVLVLMPNKVRLSHEEKLTVRFTVSDYPGVFEARGKVARIQLDILAVMFLEEPVGLENLLRWLDRQEPSGVARSQKHT